MGKEWITIAEAASLIGYHIRRLIRLEESEARKFGPIWQVNNASFSLFWENVSQSDGKR